MGKGHTDVAVMVVHCLPCHSPFRGRCRCPAAQVRLSPLTPFVVVTFARLVRIFRTPVYLRYHDRLRLYHRHLTLEVADKGIVIAVLVGHVAIPAGIYMYGIREIILTVGDRILGVILLLALIARTRHPDDALKALCTNLINHRLEVIMQCFIRIRAITQMNPHRLVG